MAAEKERRVSVYEEGPGVVCGEDLGFRLGRRIGVSLVRLLTTTHLSPPKQYRNAVL